VHYEHGISAEDGWEDGEQQLLKIGVSQKPQAGNEVEGQPLEAQRQWLAGEAEHPVVEPGDWSQMMQVQLVSFPFETPNSARLLDVTTASISG
jgi:hypothetical protein